MKFKIGDKVRYIGDSFSCFGFQNGGVYNVIKAGGLSDDSDCFVARGFSRYNSNIALGVDPNEYPECFEFVEDKKQEEIFSIEEAFKSIREYKPLEYRDRFIGHLDEWKTVYPYQHIHLSLAELLNMEFRVKKEKIKRYQVLFKWKESGLLDTTSSKYKDEKDFFYNVPFKEGKLFISLIKESEEGCDE